MNKDYDNAVNDYEQVQGDASLETSDSYILLLILAELKGMRREIRATNNKIGRYYQ